MGGEVSIKKHRQKPYNEDLSVGVPPPKSAFSEMLSNLTPPRDKLRIDINKLLRDWHGQRIWSINLAPELVAHDEHHALSVERLLAELVQALWLKDQRNEMSYAHEDIRFSYAELIWLSVAAWLHDWGHVGGTIRRDDSQEEFPEYFSHTTFVRELHGLISQNLLYEATGIHGVDDAYAWPAAVLCGHHQGWTSFNEKRATAFEPYPNLKSPNNMTREEKDEIDYRRGLQADLRQYLHMDKDKYYDAPSYFCDVKGLWNDLTTSLSDMSSFADEKKGVRVFYERMRFLLALLRIADGADLGKHRTPGTLSSKTAFLGRCLFREALRISKDPSPGEDAALDGDLKKDLKKIVEYSNRVMDKRNWGRKPWGDLKSSEDSEVLLRLRKYATFLELQDRYFQRHENISDVSFDGARDAGENTVIEVVVNPIESLAKSEVTRALKNVREDLLRELRRPGVADVLRTNLCEFVQVRDALDRVEPRSFRSR